jgi:hypothetical protein
MIIGIEDDTNYMQRSHDEKFGFWLRLYRDKNPGVPLERIAKLMGIVYNEQFYENVRRVKL